MDARKLGITALALAAAVAAVPWLLPSGPTARLDASQLLGEGRLLFGTLAVFAGGLLTALTPCVYPLIPITVSVLGGQKGDGRARALLLTSAYVVGMGIVFSALGVLAAKTGQAFGALLGHPAVVLGLALFLVLLASSMFGAFALTLPYALQRRLSGVGEGGVAGAFLMGSVAGFLAAPCTGPVLTGLLTFVAHSQNTGIGATLLFVYALGIGVPFFVLGVFTVRLPKGGVWMEWVKSVLGIVLLALAFSYVKDAFPWAREQVKQLGEELGRAPGTLLAALLAGFGVLVGAIHRSFKSSRQEFALKGVGVALVVAALVVRSAALDAAPTGALWGALGGGPAAAAAPRFTWDHVFPEKRRPLSLSEFDQALADAKEAGKPVMIDFFAEWCAACKELDRETYPAPAVIAETSRFLNIKIDATHGEDAIDALMERFGVEGLPTVAFVSSTGELLQDPRVTGFVPPALFLSELKKVR